MHVPNPAALGVKDDARGRACSMATILAFESFFFCLTRCFVCGFWLGAVSFFVEGRILSKFKRRLAPRTVMVGC